MMKVAANPMKKWINRLQFFFGKSKIEHENIREDSGDIPKPSEKELKLAELARREKANLKKSELLANISQRKNGKIVIGIPSLADVSTI